MTIKIGLIGDYAPEVTAHVAIPQALALAARETGIEVEATWLATESLAQNIEQLASYNALWCVPASPYRSMEGALAAIRWARHQGVPFLGTCGGFQHALIEYARNVLGCEEADHAETNPDAAMALVTPLSCSLVEAEGAIKLREGSQVSRIYGQGEIVEQYHCRFGFNPRYMSLLASSEMKVTGVDADGEVRVIELTGHPFFIATLFQPERSALSGRIHPLIRAYVQASVRQHH